MSDIYNFRLTKAGNNLIVKKYSKSIKANFKKKSKKKKNKKVDLEKLGFDDYSSYKKSLINKSIKRTKDKIILLIMSNPQLIKFLTLTFDDYITNLTEANPLFTNFIARMKYTFNNFEYIAVPEFMENGKVHYHLLCNLKYVHFSKLVKMWGHGHIDIKRIDRVTSLAHYMSKYLNKGFNDSRYFRKKKLFYSLNLNRPIDAKGAEARQLFSIIKNDLDLLDSKTYGDLYSFNMVEYNHYHVNDDIYDYVDDEIKELAKKDYIL